MTYVQPSAPQSIGGVIDDAIRLYRASFRRCWVFAFALSAVIAVFEIALIASSPTGENSVRALSATGWPRISGLYLISMLLSGVCYGAMLTTQYAVARGAVDLSLGRALTEGVRRLPGMIGASLIFVFVVMLSTAALIVPGIYVWGKLQLWMPAMFVDGASGAGALEASWRLTEGHWWRGATIFTVGMIILFVVSFALGTVGGVLVTAVHLHSRLDQAIALQLVHVVIYTLVYPTTPAVLIAMYRDFKLRREGDDLAARLGALSNA